MARMLKLSLKLKFKT